MFTYYRGYRGAAPKLARGSDPPCPESGLRQRAEAEDLPKIEKMGMWYMHMQMCKYAMGMMAHPGHN